MHIIVGGDLRTVGGRKERPHVHVPSAVGKRRRGELPFLVAAVFLHLRHKHPRPAAVHFLELFPQRERFFAFFLVHMLLLGKFLSVLSLYPNERFI